MSSSVLAAPRTGWVVAWIGLFIVSGIVLLAIFGRYTQHVTAVGQLVPSQGLFTLNATSAGSLATLHVFEGQRVRKGEVLAEISGELDSAAMGGTYTSVSRQLRAERTRLRSDLSARETALSRQKALLEDGIHSLDNQLGQLNERVVLQQQQADINQDLLRKMQPLTEKGYISTFQIVQQRGTLLDQRSQLKALNVQILTTKQQLQQARNNLAQLPMDAAAERNAIESKLADVEQALAQNEARRAYVIRAPRDGVISAVLAKPGQAVQSGQPVVVEMPLKSKLQAQLFIPSQEIGFIHPGSSVLLRIQAFPYQNFGQAHGVVSEISRSALSPDDIQRLTGKRPSEPHYQVRVSLDNQATSRGSQSDPLLPGMAVDASIVLRKRHLVEWFFEPLHDFKWRFQ